MTQQEKQFEIAKLTEEVNSGLIEYNKLLKGATPSYQLRKDMRVRLRGLQTEIDRITSLPAS